MFRNAKFYRVCDMISISIMTEVALNIHKFYVSLQRLLYTQEYQELFFLKCQLKP